MLALSAAAPASAQSPWSGPDGPVVQPPPRGGKGAGARIVGGGFAAINTWPYQVALVNATGGGSDLDRRFCGGTLIRPRVVLTAAHCASLPSPLTKGDDYVVGGTTKLSDTTQGYRRVIVETAVHPSFVGNGNFATDAALLLLDQPAPSPTVTLAGPDEQSLWAATRSAFVTGWGAISEGGPGSDDLKQATIPMLGDAPCMSAYGAAYSTAVMTCAGVLAGGIDSCQGDSGGPLSTRAAGGEGGTWRVAGIVSFGVGCARPGIPAVYSRVGDPTLQSFIQAAVSASPDPGDVVGSGGSFVCDRHVAVADGTTAGSSLLGTPGKDVIAGLEGDDTISAWRGKDVACGGDGNDKISGGPGRDRLIGGPGKDVLIGGKGKDVCIGNGSRDKAVGCERRRSI